MSIASTGRPEQAAPRSLTIGTVCRRLKADFPDISISKIRYLEDQGLLTPRRTQGGYRLFGEEDVERLRRILELQRDEFLPLRVIRQQLDAEGADERRRRRAAGLDGSADEEATLAELCERAEIGPELARELEDFGLLAPRIEAGERVYGEADVEVARVCGRLARYGIDARHLRSFRTAADREAALLATAVAPQLRARSPERRRAAIEDLQTMAELAQELSGVVFWRELKRVASV